MTILLALVAQASLPAVVTPAGRPTFEENWGRLDAGTDQVRPANPHRWRTVLGNGGALSKGNRSLGSALFVDPSFPGIANGKMGLKPLGLNPFKTGSFGLAITARRSPPALSRWLMGQGWISGLLTTKFSFAQLRGYFEMTANLPGCVKGAWPAFWLLPVTGVWPNGGEIDAPETVGTGNIFWSTHSGIKSAELSQATRGTCTRGAHRYGVLWRKNRIGFYYDRKLVASTQTPSDFNTPMYMLVNLAMEGGWAGKTDPKTQQVQMFVHNITVWPEQ